MTETRIPPQASPRYETTSPEKSGWSGWVDFAGMIMILVGIMHAIEGLVGIFKVVSVDYTTWGWVHLIVGIVVVLAGFALMTGAMWARIVGICLACLSVASTSRSWLPTPSGQSQSSSWMFWSSTRWQYMDGS